jgi:peptidoglycan/xylan/chitin deacetylase (PgdA/CDA1 family)
MSDARIRSDSAKSPYARRGQAVRLFYLVVSVLYWLVMRLADRPAGIVVLCYHSLGCGQLRRFAWQMRHVARRAASPAENGRPMPPAVAGPRICVTFDDGFEAVLKYALPAMQALAVPATMFVVPGSFGTAPGWAMPTEHPDRGEVLASAAELAVAAREGLCAIGSHTLSHVRLPGLAAPQLTRELRESKAVLEELLRTEVADLAFPYGEYDAATVECAVGAGYVRLFTLEPQLWRAGQESCLIGRFLVCPQMWRSEFALTCAGAYAWLSGWRRLWRRLRAVRWARRTAAQEAVAA